MPTIQARYENGVFKPTGPVALPEGCEVTVEPTALDGLTPLETEIRWLTTRSPTEVARDREQVLQSSRPARPLPEGKTLADVVEGQWPGDESDEEVRIALERLS